MSESNVTTGGGFMIRRKTDGLFSRGGSAPRFSKNGKIWRNIGHVKLHIREMTGPGGSARFLREHYADCELVEVELNIVSAQDIGEFVDDCARTIRERKEAQERRRQEWKEKRERQQARELIKRYGTNP